MVISLPQIAAPALANKRDFYLYCTMRSTKSQQTNTGKCGTLQVQYFYFMQAGKCWERFFGLVLKLSVGSRCIPAAAAVVQ